MFLLNRLSRFGRYLLVATWRPAALVLMVATFGVLAWFILSALADIHSSVQTPSSPARPR